VLRVITEGKKHALSSVATGGRVEGGVGGGAGKEVYTDETRMCKRCGSDEYQWTVDYAKFYAPGWHQLNAQAQSLHQV